MGITGASLEMMPVSVDPGSRLDLDLDMGTEPKVEVSLDWPC